MLQNTVERFGEGKYVRYRIPSVTVTDAGTVICAYESRYGSDWGATDLTIRISRDRGRTLSDRRILCSGEERNVIHNPVLFADGDTVHLLYFENYRRCYYVKSTDEGESWSSPREITPVLEKLRSVYPWTVIAGGPGHGTVLSSGRLVIPLWVASNREQITSHHPSVVTTLYSNDRGVHWQLGEVIPAQEDFIDPNESVLAELSDHSVIINCRHETKVYRRKVGFSPDGISGWHDFYFEEQLPDYICAAGLCARDGILWFTNCAEPERKALTIRKSTDDGKHWSAGTELLYLGGYSDVFAAADGNIYVLTEARNCEEDGIGAVGLELVILSKDEVR